MEDISENKNTNQITEEVLSQNSIFYLRNTAPWMKFVSIVGFLMCLLFIAFAVIIIMAPVEATNPYIAKLGTGMKSFIAVLYIIFAIILFFPNVYLFRYAVLLKKFTKSKQALTFEKSLLMQKKFWKYIGVLVIIYLSLFGITILSISAGALAGLLIN